MNKHLQEQRTDRKKKARAEKRRVRKMNAPFISKKKDESTQAPLEL